MIQEQNYVDCMAITIDGKTWCMANIKIRQNNYVCNC